MKKQRRDKGGPRFVNFVRAGYQTRGRADISGLLGTSGVLQLLSDIMDRMQFLKEVAFTN